MSKMGEDIYLKRNRIVLIILIFLISGMILSMFIVYCITTKSLDLKTDNVYYMQLTDQDMFSKNRKQTADSFYTKDTLIIKDCISTLNSISLRTGENLEKELEESSPLASVEFFDLNGNEIYSVYFHGGLLKKNNEVFYRIDISEYEKMQELCKKYGNVANHRPPETFPPRR